MPHRCCTRVRRALMALSRDDNGHVPRLFSGHEREGAPARSGGHDHVFLAADDADGDGHINRLIVAAPWACDRTTKGKRENRACFDRVSRKLIHVRAGKLGVLNLGPARALAASDPLIGPAHAWESRTAYCPTRHAGRGKDLGAAVVRRRNRRMRASRPAQARSRVIGTQRRSKRWRPSCSRTSPLCCSGCGTDYAWSRQP